MWPHYQTSILKSIARVALHQRQTRYADVLDVNCFTTAMRSVAKKTPFDSLLICFSRNVNLRIGYFIGMNVSVFKDGSLRGLLVLRPSPVTL